MNLIGRVALALAITALPGFSDAIAPDGTYWEFIGFTVGSQVSTCAGNVCLPSTNPSGIAYSVTTPWTFNGPASLLVLDLFLSGDRYEVFDSNVSLGMTSAVSGVEFQCGLPALADITCSLNSPLFSKGYYNLGPGAHSITINYLQTTSVAHSGAALQLTAATPEPPSFALAASVLGIISCIGLYRRRRAITKPRIT